MQVGDNERTVVIIREPGSPRELVRMDRIVVRFEDVQLIEDAETRKAEEKSLKGGIGRARARGISPEGEAAKRRKMKWNQTRDVVKKRRKCEICGSPVDYKNADPAHIFGRSNQIPRELADTPELVACACRPCHRYVDTHPSSEETTKLKWKGVRRFAYKHKLEWEPYRDRGWTPLQAINDLIRITRGEESVLLHEGYSGDTDSNVA